MLVRLALMMQPLGPFFSAKAFAPRSFSAWLYVPFPLIVHAIKPVAYTLVGDNWPLGSWWHVHKTLVHRTPTQTLTLPNLNPNPHSNLNLEASRTLAIYSPVTLYPYPGALHYTNAHGLSQLGRRAAARTPLGLDGVHCGGAPLRTPRPSPNPDPSPNPSPSP